MKRLDQVRGWLEHAITIAEGYGGGPDGLRIVTIRIDEARSLLAEVCAQAEQPKAKAEPVAWRCLEQAGNGRVTLSYHEAKPTPCYWRTDIEPLYTDPPAPTMPDDIQAARKGLWLIAPAFERCGFRVHMISKDRFCVVPRNGNSQYRQGWADCHAAWLAAAPEQNS